MIRKFFHGSTHFVVNHRLSVMCDENHMIGKEIDTMLPPVVSIFLYPVLFVFDIISISGYTFHNNTSLVHS